MLRNILFFSSFFPVFMCCLLAVPFVHGRQPMAEFEKIRGMLPDKAIEADRMAQALLTESLGQSPKNDSMVARSYYLLGLVNYFRSKDVLAAAYFEKALNTDFGKTNLKIKEACLNNLGVVYDKSDKITEALDAYTKSLQLAEQRHDSSSIASSWVNIGLLNYKKGALDQALDLFNKVMDYSRQLKDSENLALGHQNLAMVYTKKGNLNLTDFHNGEAYKILKAQGNFFLLTGVLTNLGVTQSERGNLKEADRYLDEAMAICNQQQLEAKKINILQAKGNMARDRGDLQLAETLLRKSEALSKATNRMEVLPEIYNDLVLLYAKQGNLVKHKAVLDEFILLLNKNQNARNEETYQQIKVLYELDKVNAEKQTLQTDIRHRNRQLLIAVICLILAVIASGVIITLYLRLNAKIKSLFRKNIEEMKQAEEASVSLAGLKTPEANLETLPSELRYRAILRLLEQEKPYLEPSFNLQQLSTRLATNQKYISQAISAHSNTNVTGLVNRFRINEARRLILSAGKKSNLNDIAIESGFSNRVSFYRQFREITGISPSEFANMASNPGLLENPEKLDVEL